MSTSPLQDALRELSVGTVAGVLSKVVDMPADTVKTRLQAADCKYSSTLNCIRRTAVEEGVRGFYRGVLAPCVGAGLENAATLLIYGRISSLLMRAAGVDTSGGQEKPLWIVGTAGFMSGFGSGTVLTPVELLKSRVQVNPAKYPGVLSCFRTTLSEEGSRALMTGYSATVAREVPGNAAWFLSYELTLRTFFIPKGKTREDAPWYAFPLSGAVGGVGLWGIAFPADTARTRQQTHTEYAKLGVVAAMRRVYIEGGVAALYRGFGISLLRAMPTNAVLFFVFEFLDRHLRSVGPIH